MAYKIDFTASNYSGRARRKVFLRLLLLAAIGGAAWSVYHVYTTYKQPTLNMKLEMYESVAKPIEEMNAAWDEAAREYEAMLRYYRLVWAANPTNFLGAMASADAPKLGSAYHPVAWSLSTGGKCTLEYRYVFMKGDKAEQAKRIESELATVVTSVVDVVDGKVEVLGVQLENLLRIDELKVSAVFSLKDVKRFPEKEKALVSCVDEVSSFRKKVLDAKISDSKDVKGAPSSARALMMAYLSIGKDKPDFPDISKAIDVNGWFEKADKFILRNRIPGDDAERRRLKETWDRVGEARYPWDRFRALDNDELVERTKVLGSVSDGVKQFKGFLDKRRTDCRKKLEPFVNANAHNDIFNKPIVESDLKGRIAGAAGISGVTAVFKDEQGAKPVVLEKPDEKFTFTWVRWTLSMGDAAKKESETGKSGESPAAEPLTLGKVADCARRALELGPGYVIDSVKVSFGADGGVSGAVLEGLLPVKKVESTKESKVNDD